MAAQKTIPEDYDAQRRRKKQREYEDGLNDGKFFEVNR